LKQYLECNKSCKKYVENKYEENGTLNCRKVNNIAKTTTPWEIQQMIICNKNYWVFEQIIICQKNITTDHGTQ
jgi:hypothetical protein